MKITQDVRDYARAHAVPEAEAVAVGMQQKAEEFRERGGEIYVPETADS